MDAPARRRDGPLLRLEGVGKRFQMGEVAVDALSHVSLDIHEGEMLVLVGPSGSGKTTILNIIGGLDSATSGEVWFRQRRMTAFTPVEIGLINDQLAEVLEGLDVGDLVVRAPASDLEEGHRVTATESP